MATKNWDKDFDEMMDKDVDFKVEQNCSLVYCYTEDKREEIKDFIRQLLEEQKRDIINVAYDVAYDQVEPELRKGAFRKEVLKNYDKS